MPARTTSQAADAVKQLTYLAGALKAPRITEAASRLADHARDAGWTHEEYLAAVLEREVAARGASGAQLRIRAAGFAARKTLEEFCLLYTSDAADERSSVDLGGRRIIKKKKQSNQ